MGLLSQLTGDLKEAMLARDAVKTSTIRFLISKINNAKIEKGRELTDEEIISEIVKDVKRHKESIEAFEQAGRDELAGKEKAELALLMKYLPSQLTIEEIAKIVNEAIAKAGAESTADFGRVMALVMVEVKGRADGATVSQIVKEKLSK